jgi:hypothetical protein
LRFFLEHSTIFNLTNFQILSIFEFSKTITFSKKFCSALFFFFFCEKKNAEQKLKKINLKVA